MSYILLEYQCTCGARLESMETRSAPSQSLLHPSCGGRAERCLSAVRGKVKVSATTGKTDTPPPGCISTREIGEGMSHNEWRARAKATRAKQRYDRAKELLS